MHRAANRLHRDDSGQMAIVGAFLIVLVVMLVAAAMFLGAHLTQRRQLQNIADSAALAGAQELNGTLASDTPAIQKAQEYIDKHATNLDEAPQIVIGDNHTSIRVLVRRTPGLSFPTFGLADAQISAHAKAIVAAPLLPGPGVVPLAIDDSAWQACINDPDGSSCENIELKEYSGSNTPPQSSFQIIDIQGQGSSSVCEWLIGGSTNPITDPVDSQPGNQSSLHNCLVQRFTAAEAIGGTHPPRCGTYDEVTDSQGKLLDICNPLSGAKRGADSNYPDAQPTVVILVPVVKNFCNGACDLDIVGDGPDTVRTFAFFAVDEKTIRTVNGEGPTCAPPGGGGGGGQGGGGGGQGGGTGQCEITGRFILTYESFLQVNNGGTTDFDPNSVSKVVRLIE